MGRLCAESGGNANLTRGMRKTHQFSKGGTADSGRGLFRFLDVIGHIPSGPWAQTGCRAPLAGTSGGNSALWKPSDFVGITRKGRLEASRIWTDTKLLRIRNQGFRRC